MRELSAGVCPDGFVIPDDPNSPDNFYPNRTLSPCAFRCNRFPLYTDSEWDLLFQFTYAILPISLIMVLLLLCVQYSEIRSRHHIYIISFGILCLLGIVVEYVTLVEPTYKRFCSSNSTPITSHNSDIGLCVIQGYVSTYVFLGVTVCFSLQSLAVYSMVIWRLPNILS